MAIPSRGGELLWSGAHQIHRPLSIAHLVPTVMFPLPSSRLRPASGCCREIIVGDASTDVGVTDEPAEATSPAMAAAPSSVSDRQQQLACLGWSPEPVQDHELTCQQSELDTGSSLTT